MFYTGEIDDEAITTLEHFAVLLYDLTDNMDNIDEVHQQSRISSQNGACQWNSLSTINSTTMPCYLGKPLMPFLPFHLQETELDMIHQNGNHSGLLRPAFPLESCYVVDAKRLQRPLQT